MPRRLLPPSDAVAALRVSDLHVTLGGVAILAGVNCHFARGAINALIGPNGAGKTTLLRAILGLTPYSGVIEFVPRGGRFPRLAYVPQRLDFDRGTPVTVRDLLCADGQRRPLFFGHARRAETSARQKLRLVGAERIYDASLGKLSGGEFQRVLVALALLGEPDILLLDEPVSGIDLAGEALFCDLLEKLRKEMGVTIVLVSHEMSIVVQHTDHVVCVSNGVVECEGNPLATLNAANIERIFGYHAAIYEHGEHHHGHVHAHSRAHGHAHSHDHDHAHPPPTAPASPPADPRNAPSAPSSNAPGSA